MPTNQRTSTRRRAATLVDRVSERSQLSELTSRRSKKPYGVPRLVWWEAALLASAVGTILMLWSYFSVRAGLPEVTPINLPLLKSLPEFQDTAYRDAMLWGTYRSGLYFGMRMRQAQGLLAGLMWFDPQRQDGIHNIRHNAEERDGLAEYGWLRHDGSSFGRQDLQDGDYSLTTELVKQSSSASGVGGDWAVRLAVEHALPPADEGDGDAKDAAPKPRFISLMFYIADEEAASLPRMLNFDSAAPSPISGTKAVLDSSMQPLGNWGLYLENANSGPLAPELRHIALRTRHFHNLTEQVRATLLSTQSLQNPGANLIGHPAPNLVVFQLTARLPLDVKFVFLSGLPGRGAPAAAFDLAAVQGRIAGLTGARFRRQLAQQQAAFDERFAKTFGDLDAGSNPAGSQELGKRALSNMLGGIGYFYGHSLIAVPTQPSRQQHRQLQQAAARRGQPAPQSVVRWDTHRSWDAALLSAVPSRSFFPRGFLWDEGFHQLLIRRWDPRLSRDILAHWLDLMNAQGWIPREQILGEEARARVPEPFIVQKTTSANPPTLFLVLSDIAARVAAAAGSDADPALQADRHFLEAAFPRLQAWFGWFNATQSGPVPGSYRWRGRDPKTEVELNPKTLTSGLDDYPRASHPSAQERHVDLRCWMALAARSLATIGEGLGLPPQQVQPYQATAELLEDFASLQALHHDELSGQFLDYGNHTEAISLQRVWLSNAEGQPYGSELRRVVGQPTPTLQLVPHFGYVTLFPLLMRLLPPASPQLQRHLQLLREPALLWTPFGLRSLARTSSLYNQRNTEHDAPYWRGPIWVNINYLAVQALQHYGSTEGPHRAEARILYNALRHNLLGNILRVQQQTGFLWENYDDETGAGKGSHPFTGWTALVVLLAADE